VWSLYEDRPGKPGWIATTQPISMPMPLQGRHNVGAKLGSNATTKADEAMVDHQSDRASESAADAATRAETSTVGSIGTRQGLPRSIFPKDDLMARTLVFGLSRWNAEWLAYGLRRLQLKIGFLKTYDTPSAGLRDPFPGAFEVQYCGQLVGTIDTQWTDSVSLIAHQVYELPPCRDLQRYGKVMVVAVDVLRSPKHVFPEDVRSASSTFPWRPTKVKIVSIELAAC
jgi:hypothetical protein